MCVGHTNTQSVHPRYTSPEGGRPVATNPFQAQQMKDQFQGGHAHRHRHHHHRHGPHNGTGPGNGQGTQNPISSMVSGIVSAIKRFASPSNPSEAPPASATVPVTSKPPSNIG